MAVAGLLIVAMCSSSGSHKSSTNSTDGMAAENSTAATEAAESEKTEEKRKGFHCLSSWDGSSRQFVAVVKENLREPDSFEQIETRIAPVSKEGTHAIAMKYRARNGFGGMNVETAVGVINTSDCSATLVAAN